MTKHQQYIKDYFDAFSPVFEQYRKKRSYYHHHIARYCGYFINANQSVLEIGCATGDLLATVPGSYKMGIDISDKLIAIAQQKYPDIHFTCEPAETMLVDRTFDVVILSNLVGYLEDVQSVFERLKLFCHRDTKIFITYYNRIWEIPIHFSEFIGVKRKTPLQNWLSSYDLKNLCYLAGLEPYKQNNNVLLPVYIPILSTLFNQYLSRLPIFNFFSLNQYTFARLKPSAKADGDIDKLYSTSIVIPARNESGNIENAILRIPTFGKHIEIVFIEGNSTDDTWHTIHQVQSKYKDTHDIKILQQTGKGKGDAVRKAFEHCTGDILMILDADLTMPPEDLPKFYHAIASGKGDFINGCRLIYPMESQAMRTLNTLGNHFFSKAFSWLLEQPIKDTLCGTKVLFRKDYEQLILNRSFFGNFDPFGDFDLLFGAYKLNLKIIDLPIRYKDRTYGDTNISRFSHGFLLLRMVMFAAGKIKFW
ncbi:MAG: glycosyltransferase [Saprospiraceae bacterium]|nr:glycosyltransferase [Saprospiraceae bacterium]MBK6815206.1 glycosyltransferase [Saprospiraceae bacterium]MBK7435292.1 glycosyltransferase [Saprospiraceae bacterium]